MKAERYDHLVLILFPPPYPLSLCHFKINCHTFSPHKPQAVITAQPLNRGVITAQPLNKGVITAQSLNRLQV